MRGIPVLLDEPNSDTVAGEGRVTEIQLTLDGCEVSVLDEADPESPVVLKFTDENTGYYINIYDHRRISRETFRSNDDSAFEEAFVVTPCLVGFRLKGKTQYIAINDIGTADMRDGGEGEKLILTRVGWFDSTKYRVFNQSRPAIHVATGICLVEPRPKPAK